MNLKFETWSMIIVIIKAQTHSKWFIKPTRHIQFPVSISAEQNYELYIFQKKIKLHIKTRNQTLTVKQRLKFYQCKLVDPHNCHRFTPNKSQTHHSKSQRTHRLTKSQYYPKHKQRLKNFKTLIMQTELRTANTIIITQKNPNDEKPSKQH